MIKITNDNVTRIGEDALYQVLEETPETSPVYALIEAELDRRIECQNRITLRRQQIQLESLRVTHAIQTEIQSIFEGFRGKKTLFLIENLGQEFIEDYVICEQSFTVTSLVAQFSQYVDVPSKWTFDTIEKARSKKAMLIYYRIYNKFMRDATKENLELLKKLLGG